jgi:glutamate N-acetyltransferase / amino-acid N-acetyltransferase
MTLIRAIPDGGITTPAGFSATGVACGLKKDGNRDLMLLVADRECTAAGVFTRNVIQAAPVQYSRRLVRTGRARVVVINAGIANACTGEEGMTRCEMMAAETARAVDTFPEMVLVCSTGVIGRQLPMDRICEGIRTAAFCLSADGGALAAQAIMTTDTRPKEAAVVIETEAGAIRVGGMAKGSGMIAPNMATMLAVLTSDAQVEPTTLQGVLTDAVNDTFNRVIVDGDTSTNDTVLLLAGGASGVRIERGTAAFAAFEQGVHTVCRQLAMMIACDGEGATKLVTVRVTGAADEAGAEAIARTIATSPLVKTALFGNDPNWGRVLAAAGRAGVPFNPAGVSLEFAGIPVVFAGEPVPFNAEEASAALKAQEVTLCLTLQEGDASADVWTCDFSYDYVRINADYTT